MDFGNTSGNIYLVNAVVNETRILFFHNFPEIFPKFIKNFFENLLEVSLKLT